MKARDGVMERSRPVFVALSCIVFGLFVLYFGLHCFRYTWRGDIELHTATVASFYRSLTHPSHEAIAAPSRYSEDHTPYMLAVVAGGRALGVTPYRALQVAGVLNLIAYVVAIWWFFRTFSLIPMSLVPTAVFLPVSLFLRDAVYLWASETSFASMRLIQAYRSLFGWVVALLLFSAAERYIRSGRRLILLFIAIGIGVLLLSHSLTASWAFGVTIVLGIVSFATRGSHATGHELDRKVVLRRVGALYAALALGLGATIFWPYFSLLDSGSMIPIQEASTFADHPFKDMPGVYVLAGMAAIFFVRRRRHLFLITAFVATFAALEIFRSVHFAYGNRYAFFMAFFPQVAVAEVAGIGVEWLPGGGVRVRSLIDDRFSKIIVVGVCLGLVVAFFTASAVRRETEDGRPLLGFGELLRAPSSHDAYYNRMRPLIGVVGPSDIVLMPVEPSAFAVASVTGAHVVISPFAFRMPDYSQRIDDVNTFFNPQTTDVQRSMILRRYGVTAILLTPSQLDRRSLLTATYGPPVLVGEGYALFKLQP